MFASPNIIAAVIVCSRGWYLLAYWYCLCNELQCTNNIKLSLNEIAIYLNTSRLIFWSIMYYTSIIDCKAICKILNLLNSIELVFFVFKASFYRCDNYLEYYNLLQCICLIDLVSAQNTQRCLTGVTTSCDRFCHAPDS